MWKPTAKNIQNENKFNTLACLSNYTIKVKCSTFKKALFPQKNDRGDYFTIKFSNKIRGGSDTF